MIGQFTSEILAVSMFVAMLVTVLIGFPVAFTLAGVAVIFAGISIFLGVLDPSILAALGNRYFGTMSNETLVAVPLFTFMGVMLERTKIAESLIITMGELFGSMRGGLGYSVVLVGSLLAASTGVVGATVVTLGLLSIPAMMKARYEPALMTGTICAAGTLGQIIPPSTVLVFLADFLQSANQEAQIAMGNFSPAPLSVGQIFSGALIPSVTLVVIYMLWITYKALFHPQSCPPLEMDSARRKDLTRRVITALFPPILLIVSVLGSILLGIATPTEAASVGSIGAILMAVAKKEFSFKVLREVMDSTLKTSCMVFIILLGASVFSLVFRGLGGEALVETALASMPGGVIGATICVMLLIFLLGFFLDTFEIIFIVVPIAAPVLLKLGLDPVWLAVAIGINLQTSYLTPPFGFALFYLRNVVPPSIRTVEIYKGALPFAGLQVAAIGLIAFVPGLVTWLPETLYGSKAIAAAAAARSSSSTYSPGNDSTSVLIDNYADLFDINASATSAMPPVDNYQYLFSAQPALDQSPDAPNGANSADSAGTPPRTSNDDVLTQ